MGSSMGGPKTFCPVPWTYSFIATNGSYKACVIAYSSETGGRLSFENQSEELNLKNSDPSLARNSRELKELRRNMLAGRETPSVCQRCIEEESHGLTSRRQLENAKAYFTYEKAQKVTREDGTLELEKTPLSAYDLRLGNLCNLSCRMCHPSQSSGWYEEWFKTRHSTFQDSDIKYEMTTDKNGRVLLKSSPYKWFQSSNLWNFLREHSSEIRELHFAGGEPLLSSEHVGLLQNFVSSGLSSTIKLDYNTNLTVLPSHLTELWPHFEEVTLGISIDGYAAMNDYIRYPSRFESIQKNIQTLESLQGNLRIWATTTLSALNIGRYPELIRWILTSDFRHLNHEHENSDRRFFLSDHFLIQPTELAPQVLPGAAKKVIRQRFEFFLHNLSRSIPNLNRSEITYLEEHLAAILRRLESADLSSHAHKLLSVTRICDDFRQQRFQDVDPVIFSHLQDHLNSV